MKLFFFFAPCVAASLECLAGDAACNAGESDDSALLALRSSMKSHGASEEASGEKQGLGLARTTTTTTWGNWGQLEDFNFDCTLDDACSWDGHFDSGTTVHDNAVMFIGANIDQMNACKICVTHGQPFNFDPHVRTEPGSYMADQTNVVIQAGRHKSSNVADVFLNMGGGRPLNGREMLGLNTHTDSVPEELNFAIMADMHFTTKYHSDPVYGAACPGIHLAQGSNSNGNNWWIGCANGQPGELEGYSGVKCPCTCNNGRACQIMFAGVSYTVAAPSNSHFVVKHVG